MKREFVLVIVYDPFKVGTWKYFETRGKAHSWFKSKFHLYAHYRLFLGILEVDAAIADSDGNFEVMSHLRHFRMYYDRVMKLKGF